MGLLKTSLLCKFFQCIYLEISAKVRIFAQINTYVHHMEDIFIR